MGSTEEEQLLWEMIEYHKGVKQLILDKEAELNELKCLDRQCDKEIREKQVSLRVVSAPMAERRDLTEVKI